MAKDETAEVVGRPMKGTPIIAGPPEVAEAVTDRPNDTPIKEPATGFNTSTFADRVKARKASEKRIAEAPNKAVKLAQSVSK